MAYGIVFAILTALFAAAITGFAFAAPEIRVDAKAVALNLLWSAVLAGAVTLLVRGAWAFAVGT